MKKRIPDNFWFPWWPDKWIFGSVRIECTPAERGIWVDLLSLASKDDGHIRANEDTPYPMEQLAGMLLIPIDDLKNAIDKFLKKRKLTKTKTGTLYVTKWDKYQFSDRHKRRVKKEMSDKTDIESGERDAIINNNKLNNNKENNNKKHIDLTKETLEFFEQEFERYWGEYDSRGKQNKQRAKKRFIALCKQGKLSRFDEGFTGYSNFLKHKRTIENFDQRPKYFSTLISDYEEYIGFEYKPPM